MSPKVRQTIYYLGTLVPGILGIALIWGGIDAGAADSIGDIIAGALALIGAGAPATAAVHVNAQRKDGTLTASPVEQVSKGIEQVIAARDAAQAEVDKVTSVVGGVLNDVQAAAQAVNLGPLASQILNGVAPAYSQAFNPATQPWNR
ncbi:holin [Mycobacterium phage ChipMunk]|nr:holin [Mycobacterium phage ChipMunk]